MRVGWFLIVALSVLAGCSRTPSGEAQPTPSSSAPAGTLALGERITSAIVPLATIASNPRGYENRVIATSGKVTAVCQERGCWMELQDASGAAHVRLHGHTFFVPKTAPGHVARVQARVLPLAANEECEEQGAAAEGGMAKVELDATGVEID